MSKKKAQPYEIRHKLVLSTGHVTCTDDELLKSFDCASADEFGFTLNIPYDNETDMADLMTRANYHGLSSAFAHLLMLASHLKCDELCLDADGPVRDDLPKFDW